MNAETIIKEIEKISASALKDVEAALNEDEIKALYVKYLGRKGFLTMALKNIATVKKEEKPIVGGKANEIKGLLQKAFDKASEKIKSETASKNSYIDVSLPGRMENLASLHPLTIVSDKICKIFSNLGFAVVEGPEIETDFYNFEALNIPKDHPARDMQDTFYVSDNIVLRTHTSPMQVRVMEKAAPPVRVIAPGKVYRCDSDVSHTPMFHQVEGLLVDENITFGNLKGILTYFIHKLFNKKISLRFRPSFFPFTEPSAEVDIACVICGGKGCRTCSHTGWLEVMGCGMVDPEVFKNVGYDPQKYSGFAFGMGVERMTMLKYGIDDIRKFFDNDLRLLGQF